jgi:tetratricopeptide (TPR) repeat protein
MEDGCMKKSCVAWVVAVPVIFMLLVGCAGYRDYYQKGFRAYDKGEYGNAIPFFIKAVESAPPDKGYFWWLGMSYHQNGQYREAVDAFKKDLASPHNKWYTEWYTWKWLAEAYDKLGQTESAISSQKKLIELTPDSAAGFVTLSKLYKDNKQYDEAITAAKRAIELKPDYDAAHGYLGVAYGMKKQYVEAIKELTRAVEIDPKWYDIYDWMGIFFMENNAYRDAAKAYTKGIAVAPSNIQLHYKLAAAYYNMGGYDDAIAAINQAIEMQTIQGGVGIMLDVKTGHPLVKGVMNNGPAEKTDIQAGDTILEIDGKRTAGWKVENVVASLKGTAGTQVVLTIGRKGGTLKKTVTREKIVQKEAASGIAIRSLAYRHKGDLTEAFRDAGTAAALHKSNENVQQSLGAAYLDRGEYEESIKQLSRIKNNATSCLLEATALAKQGKVKEAAAIYLSIPEEALSPKNIPQTEDRTALLQTFKPIMKEYRDRAAAYESKEQYKEALAELSEALKTADDTEAPAIQEAIFSIVNRNPSLAEMPEDARKYALRGEVLVKEGSFEQAIREFKKAIRLAPYAARLFYNIALMNAELKKFPEAIRYMKIYCKAAPDAPDTRAAKDEIIKWEFMMEKRR